MPLLAACIVMVIFFAHTAARADVSAWIGEWHSGNEKTIGISAGSRAKELLIEGAATFGAEDSDRIALGSIHAGSFSVVWSVPEGNVRVIAFTVDDERAIEFEGGDKFSCRLRMEQSGDHLNVSDNGQCGGLNVTFTGIYRRSGSRD
ncbi:hypothetical protein [Sinorhizobium meliloti]|uniref:DUF1579 domain-containing protein n=1 Tax=Rhizobium meliloti TaxID=382 RepID=A0AAW9TXQ7_RHIML|nr:hypothetical protein [Sinorhizobium meliloti]MQW36753.1 hypothetical protein [Sinorhizobium meliloti]